MNKLALGTVQFGLNYGISNSSGKTEIAEVKKIIEFAWENEIDTLDTAQAYGDSEQVLGSCLKESRFNYKIISKLPADFISVDVAIKKTLENLNSKKLYGYLYHNFDAYIQQPNSIQELITLKNDGIIQKIGFSLYKTEELEFLLSNNIKFDIVQFPYSVFDRRFKPYLSLLKSNNIEIHTRSAFLQGLAFMNPDQLDFSFSSAIPQLRRLGEISRLSGLSIADICLLWCTHENKIDKVVIGVNTLENLKDNVFSIQKEFPKNIIEMLNAVCITDGNVLFPYLWKKK